VKQQILDTNTDWIDLPWAHESWLTSSVATIKNPLIIILTIVSRETIEKVGSTELSLLSRTSRQRESSAALSIQFKLCFTAVNWWLLLFP
jgi:hypothetical protein